MERGAVNTKNATAGIAITSTSNYSIRQPFKDKFRPAEAKATIEKLLPDSVQKYFGPGAQAQQ